MEGKQKTFFIANNPVKISTDYQGNDEITVQIPGSDLFLTSSVVDGGLDPEITRKHFNFVYDESPQNKLFTLIIAALKEQGLEFAVKNNYQKPDQITIHRKTDKLTAESVIDATKLLNRLSPDELETKFEEQSRYLINLGAYNTDQKIAHVDRLNKRHGFDTMIEALNFELKAKGQKLIDTPTADAAFKRFQQIVAQRESEL